MRFFISADVGTQGTKAAVIDEKGGIRASAFRAARLIRSGGGSVEQHPEDLFRETAEAVKEALARADIPAEQIAALALDGQMAGILGIDKDWNPVTPYDSWLDTRCASVIPEIKAWGEEELIAITGCPVTYAHGPKLLWWKKERPDGYRQAAKFIVPAVYVAGRLAGLKAEDAFIDHTYLHFTGFADTQAGEWSDTLLHAFGMEQSKLPRIVRPWDLIGAVTPESAALTGLPAGTPIAAGCGDTAACALGAGLVVPGRLLDVAGTASVLACCVDRYAPDSEHKTLLYARSVLPGLFTPLAYIGGGGECIDWYRRLAGGSSEAEAGYAGLNREGELADPGSGGLLFIPHFGGRACPNDNRMQGGWLGLHRGHSRGALYRAILESVAYEYAGYLRILERTAGPQAWTETVAVGGGTASALFNRIKADVLGLPYITLRNQETALTANALIAGFAVGSVNDLAEAAQKQAVRRNEYRPDPGLKERYAAYAARYHTAVTGLSALYEKLEL